MAKKIVLLKPNGKVKQYNTLQDLSAIEPPLWLAIYAKKFYHKGTAVEIIDAEVENYTEDETVQAVLAKHPDRVIILSTGSHPSAHIQQKDSATRLDILLSFHVPVEIHDHLPFNPCDYPSPFWELLPMPKYRAHNWHCWGRDSRIPYGVVFTSVGCPFNCNFCCIKDFYGQKYQQREVKDVIYDFYRMKELGIKNIKIMDELFTFNPTRVEEICKKIIEVDGDFNIWTYGRIDIVNPPMLEIMRKAGIRWIAYGIESGNDEIRKNILKGNFNKDRIRNIIEMTKSYGIYIVGNYMFGFWDDTLETMQETIDFAQELNCEYANFYCTVAYPGSKLYDEMLEQQVGLPTEFSQYAQYNKNFKPLPTKTLKSKEVLTFRDKAFTQYFTNTRYLEMMQKTFGDKVVQEIRDMVTIKLERN